MPQMHEVERDLASQIGECSSVMNIKHAEVCGTRLYPERGGCIVTSL